MKKLRYLASTCLLFLLMGSLRGVEDTWVAEFDRKFSAGEYREANTILLGKLDEILLRYETIHNPGAELSSLFFRATALTTKGKTYRDQYSEMRNRLEAKISSENYAIKTKLLVYVVMHFNLILFTPERSLELYDRIPPENKSLFGVDLYVYDQLWERTRFTDIAESQFPRELISQRKLVSDNGSAIKRTYLRRTHGKHLSIIGKQIVALRQLGRGEKASRLFDEAAEVFQKSELIQEIDALSTAVSAASVKQTPK